MGTESSEVLKKHGCTAEVVCCGPDIWIVIVVNVSITITMHCIQCVRLLKHAFVIERNK